MEVHPAPASPPEHPPLVLVWHVRLSGTVRNYCLAALRLNGMFYGYIHIRLPHLKENRSFDGSLTPEVFAEVHRLVEEARGERFECDTKTATEGFVAIGTRGPHVNPVLTCSAEEPSNSQCCRLREIICLVEPTVIAAAHLENEWQIRPRPPESETEQ